MSCRKCREVPLTMEEVREFMKQEKAKRGMLFGVVIGVVLALVAVVLWVAHRKSKDLEEHYEYFDDDFEDEFDEDEFDEDDDLYGDEEAGTEGVEYVKIKDFMNYDTDGTSHDEFNSKEDKEDSAEKAEEEK